MAKEKTGWKRINIDSTIYQTHLPYLRFMIKNIIYDFGGVIYNIDFKKTFEAFEALGFSNFDDMFSQHHANALFQNLETGKITPQEFYKQIKNQAPQPITDEQIRDAWNALLLNYRLSSLQFLTELKERYNLYLLSNTNAIHYDHFSAQLRKETSYPSLESFFTKAYYSHGIGLRKPNTDAYEFVLNDAGIKAEETIFVDDTIGNLPNAEKLGIKTVLLQPGMLIENIDYDNY